MKKVTTILFSILTLLVFWGTALGQVRINEVRSNDESGDDIEFIELIGVAGTNLSGYEIYHVNGNGDSEIFTHTIGAFTLPDDGINDSDANSLGFYVLGAGSFSSGVDESVSSNLQGGPDGIILYNASGDVVDAVAWGGVGDISNDITTSGSPEADNYLHEIGSDSDDDNSLQAPNDVVGDDGSGWTYNTASIGSINASQTSGSIILASSLKGEPANHVTSFTATGSINSVDLSWTDATGTPTPDAYLIKVSDTGFGSISNPSDTNPESNDNDLSDGSGVFIINYGMESATFSGLDETTIYYFKIFPYTNTGSDIDYKTDGTVPQDDAITLKTPDIVLNEFLADPPSGSDPNGDENASISEDEFIEFVNTGNTDLDITGWTIEEEGGLAHTFPSTVLGPGQPIVVFSGGSADGYFGGAIAQTSSDGFTLNNGSDTIILKNDSGVEIIHYSYGSEAGNDESITRNPDLTGNFDGHTSADPDGSAFSPGLRLDGFAFLPVVQITGTEGWRMLSSPTSNNSYKDLLGTIWTQGSNTGANYAGGDPNVLTYDGSSFNKVDDLTSTMNGGEGFLVFIFSDDDYTNSGDDTGFPKVLEMSGTENSGSVSPSINSGSGGEATLVGNPYLSPIDWDLLSKSNLTNTVYVYDHSYGVLESENDPPDEEAPGVSGSYRAWNATSGSLDQGRIAPFQGFWVITDASGSASLTIEESDKTVGGTFYKDQIDQSIIIHLKAETERMFNETFFSFNEEGQLAIDNYDGLELSPLDHGDYLSLATEYNNTLLDINNLPVKFSEPLKIPLHIQKYQAVDDGWISSGGQITLSWPKLLNIPSEWSVTLIDKLTGDIVNLKESNNYTIQLQNKAEKIVDKKPFNPFSITPFQQEKASPVSRFVFSIDPGSSETNLKGDIPDQFTLQQNYPNPFNPTTTIQYKIAKYSPVELNIYDVAGKHIITLVSETKSPGTYQITWDASNMASGIYHYRLEAGGVIFNRQMTLIK